MCLVIILICLSYNIYLTAENSFNKSSTLLKKAKSVKIEKVDMGQVKLFNNAENSFEDMYNFKVDLKFLRKKKSNNNNNSKQYSKHEIEIWGKASIGDYLWNHILDGNSTTYANGLIKHGEIKIQNLLFRFRSGPGIVQTTVPTSVKNLILVLNGKDDVKIKFSKNWLDYLIHFKNLKNVGVVLLGDEKCDNNWILQYLKTRGGLVDFVFLIYDCKLIDNREFYQWPLGVATYRGFPLLKLNHVNVDVARQHLCSFMGTVYKNSTRVALTQILKKSNKCFVASRDNWVPGETYESMSRYLKKLSDSDLTLNPVGQNTECYRIYEALSLGTLPIVENVVTPGDCDSGKNSPLRLLKEYNAPLIFIDDWNDLNSVLESESKLSLEIKIKRRKKILKWYDDFKRKMKNRFVKVIKEIFFNED